VEFRLRNARAGVAPSVFCGLHLIAYCRLTWGHARRGAVLAVAVAAIAGSLAMLAVPLHGLMTRPLRRDLTFLTWSGVLIALITIVTALDGGVSSPLAVFSFMPPRVRRAVLPPAVMVAVVVVDLAAYVGTATLMGQTSGSRDMVVAMSLAAAGACAPGRRASTSFSATRSSPPPTRSPAR
jgi:hypothetical protein